MRELRCGLRRRTQATNTGQAGDHQRAPGASRNIPRDGHHRAVAAGLRRIRWNRSRLRLPPMRISLITLLHLRIDRLQYQAPLRPRPRADRVEALQRARFPRASSGCSRRTSRSPGSPGARSVRRRFGCLLSMVSRSPSSTRLSSRGVSVCFSSATRGDVDQRAGGLQRSRRGCPDTCARRICPWRS